LISGSYCRVGILLRSQHRSGNSSVTESSVALPPNFARGIHARSTNAHFIASRGGAASLSQMPVAHGGSVYYLSTFRVRALDPTVHRVQAYPRGAGKRRPDEIRCYRLVAQRPESATHTPADSSESKLTQGSFCHASARRAHRRAPLESI
jgi:hypothetical protein